eukprot:TRINITY_DN79962_c0_g1_i1.p1 TRINITY_DN79962_c0_g1~~TRINITY_DN79962_c0_g1_i1.p1  ORF type:complete len:204 (+),score=28.13 TRINITY_DN79962_c0_g1_i1:28-612(+)
MGNMIFNDRVMGGDKKYNFDDYMHSNGIEEKVVRERRIFPQHMYGGPKGLGDPKYRDLSKMEEDPLLPQRMRDISRTQLCAREYEDFCNCSKDNGFWMIFRCRDIKDKMVNCQMDWFDDPEFQESVKEEYLNERSHYRETGIKTKRYKRGNFVKRDMENDPPLDENGKYRPQKPTGWDESYPDGPPSWANFKYN